MSKKSYIDVINNAEINVERKKEITNIYSCEIEEKVLKAISVADSIDFFDDEKRALSYIEIKSASDVLEIDALSMGIIPIIDTYDCTYIVYLVKEKKWAMYSIDDGIIYKKTDELEDLL